MREKKEFCDCQTYDERWNWIESIDGQRILQSRPRIRQLYLDGKLKQMLYDPHWVDQLNRWLLVSNHHGFGMSGQFSGLNHSEFQFRAHPPRSNPHHSFHHHSHAHHTVETLPHPPPNPPRHLPFHHYHQHDHHHQPNPLNPHPPAFGHDLPHFPHLATILSHSYYPFRSEQKYEMLIHGFIVIPNIIPEDVLQPACEFIERLSNERSARSPRRPFLSEFSSEECLMNLFYKTPIQSMTDSLFYGDNPHFPSHVHQAQIALRPPQSSTQSLFRSFFSERHIEDGKRWHIDGLAQRSHTSFSLLVGVALSDQMLENCGNLTVFPGSHHVLLPFLQEFVSNGYLPESSDQSAPNAFEIFPQKPCLESSQQLFLKKGDVVLVHQKIAHRGAVNTSHETRKMIYFRVAPHRHQRDHDVHLQNLWVNFQGLQDILS